jgi:hypothetical protein
MTSLGARLPARDLRRLNASGSAGRPLDQALGSRLGESIGHDFSQLRVFDSGLGDSVAGSLGADAVAMRNAVFVASTAPPLSSLGGQTLLAHEAAHVAQFALAGEGGSVAESRDEASPSAEVEADRAATSFLSGGAATLTAEPAAFARAERGWLERFGSGLLEEGLGGLFDYSGMMDRQSAQDELAGRFDVRAPGDMPFINIPGNVVSQEQYRDIARQWSDIRLGRSDIKLDTAGMNDADASAFREATMSDIADLMQTRTGRGMIGELGNQRDDHTTTIHRRADNQNASGGAAAGSVPGSWADSKGTNAEVTYMPGDAGGIVQPGATDAWLPMRSDVTLMHELTHAYHAAHGTLSQGTIDDTEAVHPDDEGIDDMEYQAVGLGSFAGDRYNENNYRFERMLLGLFNHGERTTGGVSDDNMPMRTGYVWHIPETPDAGAGDGTGAGASIPMPWHRHQHGGAHVH